MQFPSADIECRYATVPQAVILHDLRLFARALTPGARLRMATVGAKAAAAVVAWCAAHGLRIVANYGTSYNREGSRWPAVDDVFDIMLGDPLPHVIP